MEPGAATERKVLEQALTLCRQHKATLLVQKVDRVTRDLEVLARIVKDKDVPVKVACLMQTTSRSISLVVFPLRRGSSSPKGPRQHWQQQRREVSA